MVLSLFAARLIQIQGIDPRSYATMAAEAGVVTEPLPALRGRILDRNGVPLADSVAGKMIVADPVLTVTNAPEIARILTDTVDANYFEVLTDLRDTSTRFRYLARRVPAPLADKVVSQLEEAEYDGVVAMDDPVRDYPARDIAANLVGVMGDDADEDFGAGLEFAFDDQLSGRDGRATYEAGSGYRLPLGDTSVTEPVDGRDLRLTIDRDVQWFAQRRLRQTVDASRAESGSVVVQDVRTGEILALADYPTFDAADPATADPDDIGARSVSDVYEPGSVQKALTAGALVDAGLVTPYTQLTVPNELPVMGESIGDWFDHGRLRLTMAGVIAKSSNIGTVQAAEQMTPKQQWEYLRAFGLGSKDSTGLAGASRGLVPDWSTWTDLSQATISYGQGISVTALQMATAFNTIANGGVRVSPSIVEGSATTRTGQKVGTDHTTRTRVISPEAASSTTSMLEQVTNPEGGTAPSAAIPGYRVAGKTGTANRVGESGSYDSFTVSFAGFAPADEPRFTVYCVVQAPQNGGGGGSTCGPVFHDVMSYLLRKYSVPPTGAAPAWLPIEWRP
ncbi:penicillin-binding protein 2 [Nocardioidaceae bacterium]|nr:penicillin-binding protein 2 [Nocardioidaceae bacterium]